MSQKRANMCQKIKRFAFIEHGGFMIGLCPNPKKIDSPEEYTQELQKWKTELASPLLGRLANCHDKSDWGIWENVYRGSFNFLHDVSQYFFFFSFT